MNLEEKLYTSTEVAKILGVSLRSVYRYLEQDKLEAEIKTATGRLRFTRKNILDFLYPDGEIESIGEKEGEKAEELQTSDASEEAPVSSEAPQAQSASEEDMEEDVEEESESVEADDEEEVEEEVESGEVEEEGEEEIDWLAKFKAAAQEFESKEPKPSISKEENKEKLSALTEEEEAEVEEVQYKYYKSMLGGLKEIAQNINKVSRKSGVDYAFTLYAGLSLEKPLKKPFSVLHAYVSSDSEDLFKKMLQLEETDEKNAQLCLMFASEPKVFANRSEKHGLFVVSDEQLVEDFKTFGLEEELEELL